MRKINIGLFALVLAASPALAQPGHGPISGGGGGGGGAPTTVDFLVKTASGDLSAERVCTDSTTATWDFGTAGQAKLNVVGLPANGLTEPMLKCVNSPTDEYVLTYESTTGDFEWQAPATGTLGGSTGSVTKAILSANGTGGSTVQSALATIDGALITLNYAGGIFNSLSGFVAGMWIGSPSGSLGSDGYLAWSTGGDGGIMGLEKHATNDYRLGLRDTTGLCWTSSGAAENVENCDTGFVRIAPGIVGASNGTPSGSSFVFQDGNKALNADFTSQSATPANLTGLTVTLKAGRKYTFRMVLRFSDSTAADGARFDFDGGAATATDFGVNCQVYDTALLLSQDTTALATDIAPTTTTGASSIKCDGSFTVNAAGTFIPRAGQEAASGGTLTVETGSYLHVTDTSFN